MDILQGNGAALRTGDRLLCDEYNVTILHKRSSVFFHNINNIILVGDVYKRQIFIVQATRQPWREPSGD